MADIDVLPLRGVPALALVDSTGIATNGSKTVAQLAAQGVRAVCAVDATGVSISGATVAQLASAGIRAFCPVDENGVAQSGATADALRKAGIRPMVLLGANGLALTGSATMLTLAQRGLPYFCPVDEAGNATTMGAVILVSNTAVLESATVGTNVGTLSVAGGTGTYTFSLTGTAGGRFVTAGTNGVNLNTALALDYEAASSHSITISATNGGTPITRTVNISVTNVNDNPPIITSNGGGGTAAISIAENTTAVTTVVASDADNLATIVYSISGGADAAKFTIGSSSGVLAFVSAPNFEVPTDADLNNQYIVIVQASDGTLTDVQTVTVTVTDAVEVPINSVAPSISGTTSVGSVLTVTTGTWSDNAANTYTYAWKRNGTAISGATASTYTLVTADIGATITCTATATNVAGAASATSAGVGPITAGASPGLAAPVLLLTSGTGDNTPNFTLTHPDLTVGDTVVLEYSTSSIFTGASSTNNTVDAGEDAANTLNFTTGTLADNTWYFRARVDRTGYLNGSWSNTETITIATAPVIVPTTWDPAHKSAMNLTNGNLTATNAGSSEGVRTVDALVASEKIYFEITWTVYPGADGNGNMLVGIANSTWAYTGTIWTVDGAAYRDDGFVFTNFSGHITQPISGLNDRIGVKIDRGAKTMAIRVNNGAWTPDLDVTGVTGSWYVVHGSTSAFSFQATANFGATAFVDTPPVGFGVLGH